MVLEIDNIVICLTLCVHVQVMCSKLLKCSIFNNNFSGIEVNNGNRVNLLTTCKTWR